MEETWLDKMVDMMVDDDTPIQLKATFKNVAKQNEVGLVNEESGAGFVIDEKGRVNLSSSNNLGILMDKEKEAMIIVAPNLHIFSKNIEYHESIDNEGQIPLALKHIRNNLRGEK